MFRSFFVCALFIVLSALVATAQTQTIRPPVKPDSKASDRMSGEDDQDGFTQDMRIKMAIARAEIDHKKHLEDVEKLSNLSIEIAKGYDEHKRLSADDLKKLGTIEKLARHVLTNSGGDEVDQKSDQMPLGDAIDKLNSTAASIKKEMTAETRFVVSATVIANSNEVISLARFIKQQKTD
jgi:hypothetical protein